MLFCPSCHTQNPGGSQFCGSCGGQIGEPQRPGTTDSPPQSRSFAPAPRKAEETHASATATAARTRSTEGRTGHNDATRYLCAAVTLDPQLARRVIDNILEEERRAVITSPGVDLVSVIRYALTAEHRRLARDAALLILLLLLICEVIIIRSSLFFFLLLFASWLTVVGERYYSRYVAVGGLRRETFDPDKGHDPSPSSAVGRQLSRVAAASENGNVTVYSKFLPFVGYGRIRTSWSFTVDVTKAARGRSLKPFYVDEVYGYIQESLENLDLAGLEVSERLYVNGHDIKHDERFLPGHSKTPTAFVSPELMRSLMRTPEERARPYLTITKTGWDGDLVSTTFIRFLLTKTDLFVEAAHTAVAPLRKEFKAIDENESSAGDFFAMLLSCSIETLPALVLSVRGVARELGSEGRMERKRRHVEEAGDYGALLSVREAASDSNWQRYFQVFDNARYVKVTEQRIARALTEFLEDRGVDTSTLTARTETLINNGVMVTGGGTLQAQQVAAGSGAQAGGIISRVSK